MSKRKQRFYGEEFMDAERKLFARLPKKYHADVRDALSKLQLWDMLVFLNVHGESLKVGLSLPPAAPDCGVTSEPDAARKD